ncbi:hypothetical protein M514_05909 [Trichuris suis]|uniref:Tc1-like transposase DDE domain-containing protein n=1 Tax=Trichuris suis TaxID=68888 RepID=A0A085M7K3_9BILA|nr:hypothetical protein M513_05909 [Trichuris suis]KFD60787.1 hypothetical protein M514_05909 [Trichuris suis]
MVVAKGIIHCSQTITAEVDSCEGWRWWPALTNRRKVDLLHYNARQHASSITHDKLDECGIDCLHYPPYSAELFPTDYHFFRAFDVLLRTESVP